MTTNPYLDAISAREWIAMVEGERGRVRDQDLYPRLRAWLARTEPGDVLDVGCGQGVCSEMAPDARYLGVDSSVVLVERARALYGSTNRNFVLGDATGLPFQPEEFDVVFSIALIHLVEDLRLACAEQARVLRSGGALMLVAPNPAEYDQWTAPYRNVALQGKRFEGDVTHEDGSTGREVLFLHTLPEIIAALEDVGFVVQKQETFRDARLLALEACKGD